MTYAIPRGRDLWRPTDGYWVERCMKWGYSTRAVALKELIEVRETRPAHKEKERAVNHCPDCGNWHMTRNIQKEVDNNAPEVREMVLRNKRLKRERAQARARGEHV